VKPDKRSFEQALDSYEKVKAEYEAFKQMQKKLGIPKRTIFNSEAITGDIEGKEFLETLKMLKKTVET
jgi:ASC-1-like (ASCH) protein